VDGGINRVTALQWLGPVRRPSSPEAPSFTARLCRGNSSTEMFDALTDRFSQLRRNSLATAGSPTRNIQALREAPPSARKRCQLQGRRPLHPLGRGPTQREERSGQPQTRRTHQCHALPGTGRTAGGTTAKLDLSANPAVISLVGLQGTGKTTFCRQACLQVPQPQTGARPLATQAAGASEQLRSVANA